ncbi:MAG: putative ABC transporter ATP-binding protein [Methanosaeta sp. PtaU1.Bin112]|nr:MAG: putative ABC transporter ATP-binding protein [Methanosaeta sp. PtaU1.Bin112]
MTTILETRSLCYSYGDGTQALRDVCISLEQGRKVALVGPNGAGKSTLMLMFNGILRPSNGEVIFRGRPMSYDAASLRSIRRTVGMVFQNSDDQLFAPTVFQDVAFGPTNLGYSAEKVSRYVGFALQYVGLSGYERRPPHHLSGGEKKRVAIAGILAMEPEVMILDEPTSNLDPASSEEIMEMLDELNSGGKTLIISTHDVDLAYRWADEVILMKEGSVARRGTGQEVFGDSRLVKDARLKLPLLVELYQELTGRGIAQRSAPPRNILELCDLLQPKAETETLGRIYICNVDGAEEKQISAVLERISVSFKGAMGTSAKSLAERCGISMDFTYGVIDKCILKALLGKNCIILTSGGMVDHIMKRIKAYGQESGRRIEATCLCHGTEKLK